MCLSIYTISRTVYDAGVVEAIVISGYVIFIVTELSDDDNTYLSRYIKSTNTRQYFPLYELGILYGQQQTYLYLLL